MRGANVVRNAKRWLPGILITAIALFIVFRLANWKELSTSLQAFSAKYFLAVFLLTTLFILFRAFCWKIVLNNSLSVWQAFWGINIGYVLNNLFPFRAGEVGKSILMGQFSGKGTFHAVSVMVIERVFDILFAASFLLITLPFALDMDWVKPIAIITLVIVAAGILIMFLLGRNKDRAQILIENIGNRWNFSKKYIVPQVESLLNGLSVLANPVLFIGSLLLVGASWIVAVVQYFYAMTAIAPNAPLWWGMFTNSVLAMGIAIPAAPASLGVFEASIVGALAILKINASAALAYGVFMHFMQFVVTGFYGVAGLIWQRKSLFDLFKETQSASKSQTAE
ncbi:MAG: flippase-like domain-containing protein [Anaerolineaceae bacterium]|nr:flippase-like domain-containing protein [Anaerolineaceae bacterium]